MKHIAQSKWLLILAGLVLHVGVASAQLHIESKIVGKKGEALPLASVYVDADKNTISNMEGEFAIDVDSTDVLRFSYVGYKTVKIPALKVGRKVTLEAEDHTLDEVLVHSSEYYVDKVRGKQRSEFRKWKWERYQFFYRQTTFTDNRCTTFLETFFTGLSSLQVRDLVLLTGRYWTVASSLTANPLNYYTFAQVPVLDNNFMPKEQLVPLVDFYRKYYQVECHRMSDGERDMYVLHFVPRDMEIWSVECDLYVDAETFELLQYKGIGHKDNVENSVRGQVHVVPVDYSFEVNYMQDNGFTEVQSVHFDVSFQDFGKKYRTSGLLYNVGERFSSAKKKLGFDNNLLREISQKGYDPTFWRENEIVKRTPVENEVIELVESDNLFGVYGNQK
ncbi:MAG: carboxypeptidase-like regulatory domain-containing protein [Prevotella sp.]|nr:carboxypeptidase-like regulatory domain-containing protein [Prevotella sp.]